MKRPGSRSALMACAIAASAIGATLPDPALAAQRIFEIAFTSTSAASARGKIVIDDAVCVNPGPNSLGAPAGCVVDLTIDITGAASGNGEFTLATLTGPGYFFNSVTPLDYDNELKAQGMSDVNFFFNAPGPMGVAAFTLRPNGTAGADDLVVASLTPLAFPFASDAQKCANAVGKAGSSYWTARHKALHACRTAMMKGTALFADKAKTVAVTLPMDCPGEFKAAQQIGKAAAKVRATIAKSCTDTLLGTLYACGATVDALADASGANGCLVDGIETNVDAVLNKEFGF